MLPGLQARAIHLLHQRAQQHVLDERGLARAATPVTQTQTPERHVDGDVLQVVLANPLEPNPPIAGRARIWAWICRRPVRKAPVDDAFTRAVP